MNRRTLLASGAGLLLPAQARAEAQPVDLLLVLAFDISRSISQSDAALQRNGYRAAITDPQVVAAITGGPVGAIAVAYIEWATYGRQQLLIPWTRIASPEAAAAWTATLAGNSSKRSPRDLPPTKPSAPQRGLRTSRAPRRPATPKTATRKPMWLDPPQRPWITTPTSSEAKPWP